MEKKSEKHLKVLICQIKSIFGKTEENLNRIKISLAKYSDKDGIDLVMFPELAFTGYNFRDAKHIFPFTESVKGQGPIFQFCHSLAKRLKSYVIFGYAQKRLIKEDADLAVLQNCKLFNSACVLDREGNVIQNASKCHLYESDDLWCQESDTFKNVCIYNRQGYSFKCTIGICMDINAYKWVSGKNELADFFVKSGSEVLLFVTAWGDHQPNHADENRSQVAIIQYWLSRLRPLLTCKQNPQPTYLFFASDKAGQQQVFTKLGPKVDFLGTSCCLRINPNEIIQKLDKKSEGYLMVETYLPIE